MRSAPYRVPAGQRRAAQTAVVTERAHRVETHPVALISEPFNDPAQFASPA